MRSICPCGPGLKRINKLYKICIHNIEFTSCQKEKESWRSSQPPCTICNQAKLICPISRRRRGQKGILDPSRQLQQSSIRRFQMAQINLEQNQLEPKLILTIQCHKHWAEDRTFSAACDQLRDSQMTVELIFIDMAETMCSCISYSYANVLLPLDCKCDCKCVCHCVCERVPGNGSQPQCN